MSPAWRWAIAGAIPVVIGCLLYGGQQSHRLEQLLRDSTAFHVEHDQLLRDVRQSQLIAAEADRRSREYAEATHQATAALLRLSHAGDSLKLRTARAELAIAAARTTKDSLAAALAAIADYHGQVDNLEAQLGKAEEQRVGLQGQLTQQIKAAAEAKRGETAALAADSLSQIRIRKLEDGLKEKIHGRRWFGFLPAPQCGLTLAVTGATLRRLGDHHPEAAPVAGWELAGAGCTIPLR